MPRTVLFAFLIGLCVLPGLFLAFTSGVGVARAQSQIEQLQADIRDRNSRLDAIQKEIAKYESALKEVGAQKSTLTSAIAKLELERGKVQADIKYTEQKISSTDLELNKLILEISAAETDINTNKTAISEIIRNVYQTDRESLIEVLLKHKHLSEVWNAIESLDTVRNRLHERVTNLHELELTLQSKRGDTESRRSELVGLKSQYTDQSSVLAVTKAERTELGVSDDLSAIDGLTETMLVALGKKGIKTLDDLGDLATDELVSKNIGVLRDFGVSEDDGNRIIMAARAHWFDDEDTSGGEVASANGTR